MFASMMADVQDVCGVSGEGFRVGVPGRLGVEFMGRSKSIGSWC